MLLVTVVAGSLIAHGFVWSVRQFDEFDYQAPWSAYAVFLGTCALIVIVIAVERSAPPQDAAIFLR